MPIKIKTFRGLRYFFVRDIDFEIDAKKPFTLEVKSMDIRELSIDKLSKESLGLLMRNR